MVRESASSGLYTHPPIDTTHAVSSGRRTRIMRITYAQHTTPLAEPAGHRPDQERVFFAWKEKASADSCR